MLFLRGEHNPILIILPSILEESKAILSIRSKAISVQSHDTADYVQCKDTEEKNRIGKTRDLFKKIRNTKGTFHAKMGSIKDRNGMGLTKAEASLVAQRLKHLPATRETRVRSLGQEDPLEKEMATHCSTLAWKISWTEEPCRLQSMGSQRVGHD